MGIPSFISNSMAHFPQFNLDTSSFSINIDLQCGQERMKSTIFYPSNRLSYTWWGYP